MEGVPLFFAVLIGLAAAGLFALILGIPTLTLRGDYLAIVTISAAEIVRYLGRASTFVDYTGGPQGIEGQAFRGPVSDASFFGTGSFGVGSLDYLLTGANSWWMRAVAWTAVGVCLLIVWSLVRSPWGRLLRGIREDEDAIRSSARTSSPSRCRRSSWAGSSELWPACCSCCPPRWCRTPWAER